MDISMISKKLLKNTIRFTPFLLMCLLIVFSSCEEKKLTINFIQDELIVNSNSDTLSTIVYLINRSNDSLIVYTAFNKTIPRPEVFGNGPLMESKYDCRDVVLNGFNVLLYDSAQEMCLVRDLPYHFDIDTLLNNKAIGSNSINSKRQHESTNTYDDILSSRVRLLPSDTLQVSIQIPLNRYSLSNGGYWLRLIYFVNTNSFPHSLYDSNVFDGCVFSKMIKVFIR